MKTNTRITTNRSRDGQFFEWEKINCFDLKKRIFKSNLAKMLIYFGDDWPKIYNKIFV